MDNYPYAQMQANAQNAYSQTADVIREASLRAKADETQKYLLNAHGVLDELENALHGPSPRPEDPPKPVEPGLRGTLTDSRTAAASLVGRLQTLLGAL